MKERLFAGGVILLLTLLGFWQFPGHTFLQSDSQLYLPILEHLWDPTVLSSDIVATHPHVTYTIYDEAAILLRHLGLDFQTGLVAQQIVLRVAGILGVFLIATALQLPLRMALLVAGIFSLGASISGPVVLTLEYEPVPRGFAVPLILLAIGLFAHARYLAAGLAAGLAILYHPPTTVPLLVVYAVFVLLRPSRDRLVAFAPIAGAAILLLILSRFQSGVTEPQLFFATIDEEWEKLLRMRGPYNWVSLWGGQWIQQHELMLMLAIGAWTRFRRDAPEPLRWLLLGLPIFGMLMLPLSYQLLEVWKWSLIPQFQPARAVLFGTVLVAIGSVVAAWRAAREGGMFRSMLWFVPAFAIPASPEILRVLLPDTRADLWRRRLIVVLGLAVLATLAAWAESTMRRWAIVPWAVVLIAPFFLLPGYAKVVNYRSLDNTDIDGVSAWAKQSTPKEAIFLFPDSDKETDSGIFRARATRTVYVDWKAGGQVNLMKEFGLEWWRRWQSCMAGGFTPSDLGRYSKLGIRYLVVRKKNRIAALTPVYDNASYAVYGL